MSGGGLSREVWETLRRLVACMAANGVAAMDVYEVEDCLGKLAGRTLAKLMDAGVLVYLDDGYCQFDECKFAVLPSWARTEVDIQVLTFLSGRSRELVVEWFFWRYGGDDVSGDKFAWWIARIVFDYSLYDSVDLSRYDLRRGVGATLYHIYGDVWLASYVDKCGSRRCFRYEVVKR